jgi:hypothetical protein
MTGAPRRFPPPWDIEEHNRSCFIVRDNNGQALAYVYFETVTRWDDYSLSSSPSSQVVLEICLGSLKMKNSRGQG